MLRFYITFLIIFIFNQGFANPYRTILVAKDGTGEFTTIQEAINSIRDLGPNWVEIKIKKGIYNEKIRIPSWKHLIKINGESKTDVILTNDDYSGKKDAKTGKKLTTFDSYTLLIEGDHIQIENLTIQNTSCNQGQAVALHVEGDYFVSKNINLKGCQDTLYAGKPNSRQYYLNCYIEGTTDFIFGQATVVFENCEIKSLANSYITAAATPAENSYGFVFFNCRLIADKNVDKVYLGRPWRPFAKTVFIDCWMDQHILPIGWDKWDGDAMFPKKDKFAFYAEYQSKGLGNHPKERADWTHQLTNNQRKKYTLNRIFNNWNPNQL